jgi:predicted RNase H-like nuclease (RuvC/YqgF family)
VVRGYPIVKAFEALTKRSEISPPVEVIETKRLLTPEETQASVKQLRAKVFDQNRLIEKLRGEIENLQRALTELGASRESLEKELSRKRSKEEMEIKKEREWFNLRREVNNLQKQLQTKDVEIRGYLQRLELLKRVNLMKVREELLLLKPIDSFTTEGIDIASKLYNIKNGDAILLIDGRGGGASTALNLVNLGVRIVVSATPISHQAEETFIHGEVPVIPSGALELSWIEGLPYVDPSILRRVLKESIRTSGEEEAVQDLSKLVDEYKRDRSAVLQE